MWPSCLYIEDVNHFICFLISAQLRFNDAGRKNVIGAREVMWNVFLGARW